MAAAKVPASVWNPASRSCATTVVDWSVMVSFFLVEGVARRCGVEPASGRSDAFEERGVGHRAEELQGEQQAEQVGERGAGDHAEGEAVRLHGGVLVSGDRGASHRTPRKGWSFHWSTERM